MKYKSEEKTKMLEEYKQSNLSATAFCKDKKLTTSTLKSWLSDEKPTFLKATASKITQQYEKTDEIRIEYKNLKIYANSHTSENLLCSVLKSVASTC
ncbi:MAG: hypothetical protein R3Y09_07575 [Clostridia bacterium]